MQLSRERLHIVITRVERKKQGKKIANKVILCGFGASTDNRAMCISMLMQMSETYRIDWKQEFQQIEK
jgi:hypothetical protein